MAGYLMDFGFGGFIGYGKGVSVGLVMEELNKSMRKKHRDGFSDLKVLSVAVQSCFIKNRSWR